MVVLALISDPPVVRKILGHLGLPTMPPPVAAARGMWEPEADLWIPPMEDCAIEERDLAGTGTGEGAQRFVQTSGRHPDAARSPP
jgi:hypothetical protein